MHACIHTYIDTQTHTHTHTLHTYVRTYIHTHQIRLQKEKGLAHERQNGAYPAVESIYRKRKNIYYIECACRESRNPDGCGCKGACTYVDHVVYGSNTVNGCLKTFRSRDDQ